jgi:hypothetical protein
MLTPRGFLEDEHLLETGGGSTSLSACARRSASARKHVLQPRRVTAAECRPCLGRQLRRPTMPFHPVRLTPFDEYISYTPRRPPSGPPTHSRQRYVRYFQLGPVIVLGEVSASATLTVTFGSTPALSVSLDRAGDISVSATRFQLDDNQLFGIASWLTEHIAPGLIVPALRGGNSSPKHGEADDRVKLHVAGKIQELKIKDFEFSVSAEFEDGVLSIEEETKVSTPIPLGSATATLNYSLIVKLTPVPRIKPPPVVTPGELAKVTEIAVLLGGVVRAQLLLLPSGDTGGFTEPETAFA